MGAAGGHGSPAWAEYAVGQPSSSMRAASVSAAMIANADGGLGTSTTTFRWRLEQCAACQGSLATPSARRDVVLSEPMLAYGMAMAKRSQHRVKSAVAASCNRYEARLLSEVLAPEVRTAISNPSSHPACLSLFILVNHTALGYEPRQACTWGSALAREPGCCELCALKPLTLGLALTLSEG
jgi:hypothetical protein